MNIQIKTWLLGGMITAVAIGFGMNGNVSAAEQVVPSAGTQMMQGNQMGSMSMDAKSMNDRMQSPDMQKQCIEMLKNPDMQKNMLAMMKTPEMQTVMKQMLQNNPDMLQMMKNLINTVDTSVTPGDPAASTDMSDMSMDHNTHHM